MIQLENNRRRPAILAAAGARLRALVGDRSGGAIIWFALTVPVVLGMAGLGVDVTLWYMDKRILQTASDSGSIAGAHLAQQNATAAEIRQAVEEEIARNDFAATADDVITVNTPPLSGPNAGSAGFVEVIIIKQRPLYFARFFRDQPTFIRARAVSGARSVGEHCVLALDEDMDQALEFNGTADADINCGVAANSRSSSAIDLKGNATLRADPAQTHGDISIGSNASLITNSPVQPYSPRVADPYATLDVPAASPCDETNLTTGAGPVTLNPGRYCGGLYVNGSDVTFNPGVYILDAGDFTANGNPTLTGTGVTFILTADVPDDVGSVKFNGGTVANLTAPNDEGNPYLGVLMYQDRNATSYKGNKLINNSFQGGALMDLQGAVYFPSQNVTYTGGSVTGDGCLHLIGRKVTFSGNGNILNGEAACAALRIKTIEQLRVTLLE